MKTFPGRIKDSDIRKAAWKMTRRQFAQVATMMPMYVKGMGEASASPLLSPTPPSAPDYTIVIFPDPQYLATYSGLYCSTGPTQYNAMMDAVVSQQAAKNILIGVSVGDCADAGADTQQAANAGNAWNKLRIAGITDVACAGNHDISPQLRAPTPFFTGNGFFGPNTISTYYGAGRTLLDGTSQGFYLGTYPDPTYATGGGNYAYKFILPDRVVVIIAVEFCPRTGVLNWAKSIHDAHPEAEVWLTTHAFLNGPGALALWNDTYMPGWYQSSAGGSIWPNPDPPNANSADMMWDGSHTGGPATDFTGYFNTWDRLTMVWSGHFPGWGSGWWFKSLALTNNAGRIMNAIYCNCQSIDATYSCGQSPSGNPAGEVLFMNVHPSNGTTDFYVMTLGNVGGTYNGQYMGPRATTPNNADGFYGHWQTLRYTQLTINNPPLPPLSSSINQGSAKSGGVGIIH